MHVNSQTNIFPFSGGFRGARGIFVSVTAHLFSPKGTFPSSGRIDFQISLILRFLELMFFSYLLYDNKITIKLKEVKLR